MTPQEKAKQLMEKIIEHSYQPGILSPNYKEDRLYHARQVAQIAIDQAIGIMHSAAFDPDARELVMPFYKQVKHEIEIYES